MELLHPEWWLETFGFIALFLVMFTETGLLVGFFLPGDSLLFTAGVLGSTTKDGLHIPLFLGLIASCSGAIIGAQVGYLIGRRAGPVLLNDAKRPKLTEAGHRAAGHLDRFGFPKAMILGRFIPIVRTVVNPLAGTLQIPLRTFTFWNIVSGVIWTIPVTLVGYFVGTRIDNIDKYLLPVIGAVVLLSLLPVLFEIRRARRAPKTPAPTTPAA
ncbi:MAG: DedA family protein [Sporichthyaceae bacterium]